MTDAAVAAVRAFNRFYTARIGVVQDGLLQTPHTLAEARVLYELGEREHTADGDLRRALGLDAGYLSRLLARLEAAGLVARETSPDDARRRRARLTPTGHAARAVLDERSAAEVTALLRGVGDEEQGRLLRAMATIRETLEAGPEPAAPFSLRPPRAGDLGWIVARHGALYAAEYGWDARFEALVARVVADYVDAHDPDLDRAWIAEADGRRAGCVLCVHREPGVAQLRLLLVEPGARGLGIGAALVDECIAFARATGRHELRLWTNDVLHAARRIYERAGFALVDAEPHRSFGHDLVGQTWSLRL